MAKSSKMKWNRHFNTVKILKQPNSTLQTLMLCVDSHSSKFCCDFEAVDGKRHGKAGEFLLREIYFWKKNPTFAFALTYTDKI